VPKLQLICILNSEYGFAPSDEINRFGLVLLPDKGIKSVTTDLLQE
jgi:hypothetical protein